jgi:hypothetical protein
MTKSFHPTGEDEDVGKALEELRYALDELKEMEHTTEWPDVEEVKEEQDTEVGDEDKTPIATPAKPVSPPLKTPAFLPLTEETSVALRPKDKQPEVPFSERTDVSPLNKPVMKSPKDEKDDDDDEGLLQLPGVASERSRR